MKFVDKNGLTYKNPISAAFAGLRTGYGSRNEKSSTSTEVQEDYDIEVDPPIKVTVTQTENTDVQRLNTFLVPSPADDRLYVHTGVSGTGEEVQQEQEKVEYSSEYGEMKEEKSEETVSEDSKKEDEHSTSINPIPVIVTDENGGEDIKSIKITLECISTARKVRIYKNDRIMQLMNKYGEIVMVFNINDAIELDFPDDKEVLEAEIAFPLINTPASADFFYNCVDLVKSEILENPIDNIIDFIKKYNIDPGDFHGAIDSYHDIIQAYIWGDPAGVIRIDKEDQPLEVGTMRECVDFIMKNIVKE